MPFARSVVLHFPAEIHRAQGVSEVAPQLLQALDVEKIAAVQFLKNGQVRVTCKTAEYRDDLLEGSTFLFGDVPIPVTAADQPIRSVFVRDLPFEVPDCDVKSAFESFGVVLSVHQCFFRDFPSVANGTRRLVMSFRGSIPSSVSVADFPVRVFHAGQPVVCSICHESGHLPRDCPFSGLCLRCKQPGHMARHCTQPWGPSSSSSSSSSSPPVSTSSSVPVSTSQSTSSTTVPSTSVSSALSAPVPSVQSQSQVLSEASLEDREIAESSEAGASSSLSSSVTPVTVQSTPVAVSSVSPPTAVSPVSCCSADVSPRPPRTSSADFKRLIRLVVPKIKLGSDVSVVKKQCIGLAKSHKLNVSAEECASYCFVCMFGEHPAPNDRPLSRRLRDSSQKLVD
ncbi:uncharacterized protein LOC122960247 [Acropora millepora]|uniref:uncharacterized protein LOC122960247 n=1 Tax=Acropora millepora TaxID=45264 RepID=UPI001CF149F3|nr:uncharacterized protein LOC122960247 [Acropora millepora]